VVREIRLRRVGGRPGAALALALALAAWTPRPAASAPKRELPGQAVELKTKDGWTLAARYHPAKPAHLTFILLHQAGGRKEEWRHLAWAMARQGFGTMALDMRGHGESRNPPPGGETDWRRFRKDRRGYNEWSNMALDVEAAVGYLAGRGVPKDSIALGGADVGSSVALRYAAVHPEAPLVFLLSPGMSYQEVLTVNAMRAYGPRPILLVVGADDKRSVPETAILFAFARRSAGDDKALEWTVERGHGARMLALVANRDPVSHESLVSRLLAWASNPRGAGGPPAVAVSSGAATSAPAVVPSSAPAVVPAGPSPDSQPAVIQ